MAKTQTNESDPSSDFSFGAIIGVIIGISIGTLLGSIIIGLISWLTVTSFVSVGTLVYRKQS